MIEGLRRRFAKSVDRDPWDANQELEPELETDEDEVPELSADAATIFASTLAASPAPTNDVDSVEYTRTW